MSQVQQIRSRSATEADYGFLWAVHQATMKEHIERTSGWDDREQETWFRGRFDSAEMQVVLYNEERVGSISVDREPERITLTGIEIAPQYQRRGIGTWLVKRLLAEADAARIPVELRVLKGNPAKRLYERLGFVQVGEIEMLDAMRRNPVQGEPG